MGEIATLRRSAWIGEAIEDVVMIALAADRTARYPDASSFAFAARRAVFPQGASLLTGLQGCRRTTREMPSRNRAIRSRQWRADELPTQPLAHDPAADTAHDDARVTRTVWAVPGSGREGVRRVPLTRRALLLAATVGALVVSLCGDGRNTVHAF